MCVWTKAVCVSVGMGSREGPALEDTLVAAVQHLAEAQTPRHAYTLRRSSGQYRPASTWGH